MRSYYIRSSVMTLILMPALAGVGGLLFAPLPMAGAALSFIAVASVWAGYIGYKADRDELPQKLSQILLPIFISFTYYMLVWVLHFGASGLSYVNMGNRYFGSFLLFTLLHFPTTLVVGLAVDGLHFFPNDVYGYVCGHVDSDFIYLQSKTRS